MKNFLITFSVLLITLNASASMCPSLFNRNNIASDQTVKLQLFNSILEESNFKHLLVDINTLDKSNKKDAKLIHRLEKFDLKKNLTSLDVEWLVVGLEDYKTVGEGGVLRRLLNKIKRNPLKASKESIKVRLRVESATKVLKQSLQAKGYRIEDSNFITFRKKFRSTYAQSKIYSALVMNGISVYALGVPLFFPTLDVVSKRNFDEKLIDFLISKSQVKNFDSAFENNWNYIKGEVSKTYKFQAGFNSISSTITATFLSLQIYFTGYYGLYKYNLPYKAYTFVDNHVIHQEYKKYEYLESYLLEKVDDKSVLYESWQKAYEEDNKIKPNIQVNALEKRAWLKNLKTLFETWMEVYEFKNGKEANINDPQVQRDFELFLLDLEFKSSFMHKFFLEYSPEQEL